VDRQQFAVKGFAVCMAIHRVLAHHSATPMPGSKGFIPEPKSFGGKGFENTCGK